MSNSKAKKRIFFENCSIEYTYNSKTENLCILNSYRITSKRRMLYFLSWIPEMKQINRSIKSCLREWRAHNWLHDHGLFLKYTTDCDLESKESILRRIGYYFIEKLYKG